MTARPWLKWYPSDWRGEPRLRMCSLAARGLWVDLLSYMHEGQPYGHLTIDGIAPDIAGIAGLVGRPLAETRKALAELETRNVFSRTDAGTIFSRRMVRDHVKQERDKANGKGGGNPSLNPANNPPDNEGVNPPVKAHIPEARDHSQKEKTNGASRPDVYAFEGKVIRLTEGDFKQWESAFPDIDLRAFLQNRDDWLKDQPEKDRKAWFNSTSNVLAKKQNEARAAKRDGAVKGLGPA